MYLSKPQPISMSNDVPVCKALLKTKADSQDGKVLN